MSDIETVKELKEKILTKITDEELDEKYSALVSKNIIFQKNKRMAYHIIANEVGADLKVSVASSSREAFPLAIGDLSESEKTNFNLSGFVIGEPRTLITKASGKLMAMIDIADNSGTITVASFEDQANPIIEGGFEKGDFVTLSNLYWADKSVFLPTFGQYSSIKKTEAPYGLDEVVVNTIAELTEGNYFTIKGVISYIPEGEKRDVYHCSTGHWFKKLSDNDIGTQSLCEKCGVAMFVEKHAVANGVLFADETGEVALDIGTFAGLEDFNLLDEFIFNGKFTEDKFKVSNAVSVKKA